MTIFFDRTKHDGMADIFQKALSRPSVATFERLLNDPRASSVRALMWMVGCALVSYSLLIVAPIVRQGSINWLFVAAIPFAMIITLLLFVLSVGVTHAVARWLGGMGNFPQLLYAFATFSAPLQILSATASIFPYVGLLLSYLCTFYGFFLQVIATRAVHRLGWAKAIVAVAPTIVGAVTLYVGTLAAIVLLSRYVDLSRFLGGS